MLCPILLRVNGFWISHRIPIRALRKQRNWLMCRQIIVFIGNLLALVYGLTILISIKWSTKGSFKSDLLCQQILSSSFITGVSLMISASFGCASPFIKSNFREFLSNFTDSLGEKALNKRTTIKIVKYNGSDPQTVVDGMIDYLRRRLDLLKRCFLLSPIFTLNGFLIIIQMPFEFSIIKKCVHYLIAHDLSFKHYYRTEETTPILVILCLNVLFISLVLINLVVFIYICDLIDTALNNDSQRKEHVLELSRKGDSPVLDKHFLNKMKIEAHRQKNILFHQFLNQNSHKNLADILSQRSTTLSKDTTINIPEGQSDQDV